MRDHFDIGGVFETTEFEIRQVACNCIIHEVKTKALISYAV